MQATNGVWGSCRFCGAAVAPRASSCGICGEAAPVAAGELAHAPRSVRRRLLLTRAIRAAAVIGAALVLVAAIVPAALSGPPNVADPLTTQGTYVLPAGTFTTITGEVTGGDFVVGNYSTFDPIGANVGLAVYNSTGWAAFLAHTSASPVWSLPNQPVGRIIFSAAYTDTYTFVVTNPYAAASGFNVTVYVATQYESNVGSDGFA